MCFRMKVKFVILMCFIGKIAISQGNGYNIDTISGNFFYQFGPDLISSKGLDSGFPRDNYLKKTKVKIRRNEIFYFLNPYSGLNMNEIQNIISETSYFDYHTEKHVQEEYFNVLNSKKKRRKHEEYYTVKVFAKIIIVKLKRNKIYIEKRLFNKHKWFKIKKVNTYLILKVLVMK